MLYEAMARSGSSTQHVLNGDRTACSMQSAVCACLGPDRVRKCMAGPLSVQTLVPAVDATNRKDPVIPFLVGRLDATAENGAASALCKRVCYQSLNGISPWACFSTALIACAGFHSTEPRCTLAKAHDKRHPLRLHIRCSMLSADFFCMRHAGAGLLPGATDTVEQFAAWFNARFQRGVYDGVALLGSHTLLDNQQCVQNDAGKHWVQCRLHAARRLCVICDDLPGRHTLLDNQQCVQNDAGERFPIRHRSQSLLELALECYLPKHVSRHWNSRMAQGAAAFFS